MYETHNYGLWFELGQATPIKGKQESALKALLRNASKVTGLFKSVSFYRLTIKEIANSFKKDKDWAFRTDEFVNVYINEGRNKGGYLLMATFDACQKYAACVDMLRYKQISGSSDDSSQFIPQFTMQLFQRKQSSLSAYESSAMEQSRNNYQFMWTPVENEIQNIDD